MSPDEGRTRLAKLAWTRYCTAVDEEGQSEEDAFLDTVESLIISQDEVWVERLKAMLKELPT